MCYCFELAVQSGLAEKRLAELVKSPRIGGKEDAAETNGLKEAGKRKCNVQENPESSQPKGKPNKQ